MQLMNNLNNYDVKLLRDRLEDFQEVYSDPADIENSTIFAKAIAAIDELLAYREAAGNPVLYRWRYPEDSVVGATAWQPIPVEQYESFMRLIASKDPEVEVEKLFAAPQLPAVPQSLLRELVDAVWNDATESTEVPATSRADELILQVFGNSEQVNSPVIQDDSKRIKLPELFEDDRHAVTLAIRSAGYEVEID